VGEEEIRKFYTHLNKEDKVLLIKLLRRNNKQDEMLLRLEETLIKTNNSLEKMTKEHEELRCSHDDLVQRYDSVLIEQRNNEKLTLREKYDMLSYSHYNLLDADIILDVSHETIMQV
jgi:hypothetical protein